MKDWKGDAFKPLVSIDCLAYNHEPYIEDALESFLIQRTDFPFEILIHDDASTDRTADIIREYEANYPNLIKPIYQKENQYSQGIIPTMTYQYPRALGKYIAICEGDDYWIDPAKLQKQVDYIQSHPDCALVAHDAIQIWADGTIKSNSFSRWKGEEDLIISLSELMGNLGMFPTASMLFRKANLEAHLDFLKQIKTFDYVIKIILASTGYVYLMHDVMSAYRKGAKSSWSNRMQDDKQQHIEHIRESIRFIRKIDEYTENKHTKSLAKEIELREIALLITMEDKSVLKKKQFYSYLFSMPFRSKLIIMTQIFFPKIFRYIQKVRLGAHASNQ